MGVFQSTTYYSDAGTDSEEEENVAHQVPNTMNYDAVQTVSGLHQVAPLRISDRCITLEQVADIEKDLDFYEKVSLAFLLYDSEYIALQYLMQIKEGAQLYVLQEWVCALMKTDRKWQTELLEALCIIQNYKALFVLGYTKEDVDVRFMPRNGNTALCINKIKKKLYLACESLENSQAASVLSIVKNDFTKKNLIFKHFEVQYLEMYLLYWITIKYISLTDLTNVCQAFKVSDLYHIIDDLKISDIRPPKQSQIELKPKTRNNQLDFVEPSSLTGLSSMSSLGRESSIGEDRISKPSNEDKCYPVNPQLPGVCLIINQEQFYTEFDETYKHLLMPLAEKLKTRDGTNIDRDALENTFKQFGFTVFVKNNRTHIEMIEDIKDAINQVGADSSLFVCILSHGIEGKVFGSNSIPIEVRMIQDLMCNTNVANLKSKPKMLILQACQGNEILEIKNDEDEKHNIETDSPRTNTNSNYVPRVADLLVFWAIVPGFAALRETRKGSWFIQSLCDTIMKEAPDMHFQDICTVVKQGVTNKRYKTRRGYYTMMPIHESTLRKFFYFPKIL